MKRITFEDKGQDFLRWIIDEDNIVIDSQPFQGWLWCGYVVIELGEGMKPTITKNGGDITLGYRVSSIEQLSNREAEQVLRDLGIEHEH